MEIGDDLQVRLTSALPDRHHVHHVVTMVIGVTAVGEGTKSRELKRGLGRDGVLVEVAHEQNPVVLALHLEGLQALNCVLKLQSRNALLSDSQAFHRRGAGNMDGPNDEGRLVTRTVARGFAGDGDVGRREAQRGRRWVQGVGHARDVIGVHGGNHLLQLSFGMRRVQDANVVVGGVLNRHAVGEHVFVEQRSEVVLNVVGLREWTLQDDREGRFRAVEEFGKIAQACQRLGTVHRHVGRIAQPKIDGNDTVATLLVQRGLGTGELSNNVAVHLVRDRHAVVHGGRVVAGGCGCRSFFSSVSGGCGFGGFFIGLALPPGAVVFVLGLRLRVGGDGAVETQSSSNLASWTRTHLPIKLFGILPSWDGIPQNVLSNSQLNLNSHE